MFLWSAAESRGAVGAVAPVVAGHVGPLQDALLAHQVQGQPEIGFISRLAKDISQTNYLNCQKMKYTHLDEYGTVTMGRYQNSGTLY